ncbi:MAG: methyltransferase domain-containing protein, partial [Phycisphaerae bacterium]
MLRREDLSPFALSMLTDILGAGSALDRELGNLSTYAEAHWGPRDPSLPPLVAETLDLLPSIPRAPALDLGCSVGRATFELARRTGRFTTGVDLNFSMLRLAEQIRRQGRARYPRRRVGI